jgi:hypothetical protein
MDEFEGNGRTRSRVIPTSELLSRQTAAVALTHSAERRDREMRQRAPTPAIRPFATSASQRMAVNKGADRIKQNSTACRTAPSTEIDTCGRKNPLRRACDRTSSCGGSPALSTGKLEANMHRPAPKIAITSSTAWRICRPTVRLLCAPKYVRGRPCYLRLCGRTDAPRRTVWLVADGTSQTQDRQCNGNPIWRGLCAGSNTRQGDMHAASCGAVRVHTQ